MGEGLTKEGLQEFTDNWVRSNGMREASERAIEDAVRLLSVPVLGELSSETIKEQIVLCEKCNKRKIEFKNLEYIFDRWNGEDIITAVGEYFISERLKEKLEEKEIKGYETISIKTSFTKNKAGVKKFGKNAYQKELPNFYHLKVKGRTEAHLDGWFKVISTCESCGRERRMITIDALNSIADPSTLNKDDKFLIPNIYFDTWNNEDDLFLFVESINHPVITQNFIDCLTELGIELNKKESIWVRSVKWININVDIIE